MLKTEIVQIELLKPHPGNYRKHGPDQIRHIVASIQAHGCYRNIVTAKDYTILAGHGVVEGCKVLQYKQVTIVRLDIEPNSVQALKILTGDNEIARLGEVDDRLLSEHLREIAKLESDNLLGTGFDEAQLANLVFVTRSAAEIKDMDAAAEWLGMPGYTPVDPDATKELTLTIAFKTKEDREKFVEEKKLQIRKRGERVWNTVWPYIERNDMKSVRFDHKAIE